MTNSTKKLGTLFSASVLALTTSSAFAFDPSSITQSSMFQSAEQGATQGAEQGYLQGGLKSAETGAVQGAEQAVEGSNTAENAAPVMQTGSPVANQALGNALPNAPVLNQLGGLLNMSHQ